MGYGRAVTLSLTGLALAQLALAENLESFVPQHEGEGGVFRLRTAVVFYVHSPQGKPFTVEVGRRDLNYNCYGERPVVVEILGPDEEEIVFDEIADDGITSGGDQVGHAGWDHELWYHASLWDAGGLNAVRTDVFSDPAKLLRLPCERRSYSIETATRGVYQVLVMGCSDHWVSFRTSPVLKYGVLGSPDLLYGTGGQFREAHLYLPEDIETEKTDDDRQVPFVHFWLIEIDEPRTRRLTVSDPGGKPLGTLTAPAGRNTLTLHPENTDTVWRLRFSGNGDFMTKIGGVPAILCPDAETALAIRGSAVPCRDGRLVQHRFQAALWDYLMSMKPADCVAEVPEMDPEAWAANENLRQVHLLWKGGYCPLGGALYVLRHAQKVYEGLEDKDDMAAFIRGIAHCNQLFGNAAYLYATELKGNVFHQNEKVRNLCLAGMLPRLLRLREGDTLGRSKSYTSLSIDGFSLMWNEGAEAFPWLAPGLPERVHSAWLAGLRRHANRLAVAAGIEFVLTNMRAAIPTALYHVYRATGDERYKSLSLRHAHWITEADHGPFSGQAPAGYFREHFAADGGYNSYTPFQLGKLYSMSHDETVLSSLRRYWRLVSHEILLDPDGTWFAGTSYNSRTGHSAASHQWHDPCLWVSDRIPEAGTFARRAFPRWDDPDAMREAIRRTVTGQNRHPRKRMSYNQRSWAGIAGLRQALALGKELKQAPLPVESTEPFFRSFGNEFIFVRHGDYYLTLYAGRLAPFWQHVRFGGQEGFSGLGWLGFWVEGYGTALLAAKTCGYGGDKLEWWNDNWHLNTLVGELEGGQMVTTGTSTPRVSADEADWSLTLTGEVLASGLGYWRTYRFRERGVAVRTRITESGRVQLCHMSGRIPRPRLASLYELIPYLTREANDSMPAKGAAAFYDREFSRIEPEGGKVAGVAYVELSSRLGGVLLHFPEPVELQLHYKPRKVYNSGKVNVLRAVLPWANPPADLPRETLHTYSASAYSIIPLRGKATRTDAAAARSLLEEPVPD